MIKVKALFHFSEAGRLLWCGETANNKLKQV